MGDQLRHRLDALGRSLARELARDLGAATSSPRHVHQWRYDMSAAPGRITRRCQACGLGQERVPQAERRSGRRWRRAII